MKFTMCLALAASGLGLVYSAGRHSDRWPVREQETIQKTLPLSGPPMRLVVDNFSGYVHVTGASGSDVRITARKTIHAETAADLEQAKREVKLDISGQPGSVSVYYDAPWRCSGDCRGCCGGERRRFYAVTYDIDVEAPRQARTAVSTVDNGDLTLDKIDGDFDVANVNGGIRMTAISGSGEAHTINGPVTVHFAKNPAGASSFKSLNGALDIYFLPGLSADLSFKTFNGQIFSDFDVTAKAAPAVETERHDGKFVYRSNRFRTARAGRGGPELTFDTFNGDIRLHREQ